MSEDELKDLASKLEDSTELDGLHLSKFGDLGDSDDHKDGDNDKEDDDDEEEEKDDL